MQTTETPERTPRWPALVTSTVCIAGMCVAGYLTYAHYTTAKALACSDKGLIDCTKVTTSSYSRIFHVPVSDMGLGYFLAMAALCSPWAWRSTSRILRAVRVIGAGVGVGLVVWLVYAELFRLDAICLYCTIVHGITVLLFITIGFGTAATGPPLQVDTEEQSSTTSTTTAVVPSPPKTHRHDRATSSRTAEP